MRVHDQDRRYFRSRTYSCVRVMPSRSAALDLLPPHAASACMIICRSTSFKAGESAASPRVNPTPRRLHEPATICGHTLCTVVRVQAEKTVCPDCRGARVKTVESQGRMRGEEHSR